MHDMSIPLPLPPTATAMRYMGTTPPRLCQARTICSTPTRFRRMPGGLQLTASPKGRRYASEAEDQGAQGDGRSRRDGKESGRRVQPGLPEGERRGDNGKREHKRSSERRLPCVQPAVLAVSISPLRALQTP